ncbi:transcription factor Ouib-like isoform X2 [Drosophila sulfurigaster albostrigata]|uniref:transcription factor Ouib-like isoform X2 n=1 Tax=Drosophila sulfurigaster albostrigata TaxID=89887 RepID=UPI002D21C7A6|nr:transcription factor Ouib-like isoform X2 [Drosophila sulfurigaster albostrigata]
MSQLILCRTCGEKIYNLNAKNLFGPEGRTLLNQLHMLTGIYLTEEPDLPKHICACCHLDLNHSISFRERCIQTNKYLRNGKGAIISDPLTTEMDNTEIVMTEPQENHIVSEHKRKQMQIAVSCKPSKKQSPKQRQTQQMSNRSVEQRPNQIERVSSKKMKTNITKKGKSNTKTYVCDQCGRYFTDASNLKIHIVRHTGIKSFECQECGEKYYTGHLLNLHIRVKHQGEMPYACKHCEQRFYTSTSRSRHEQLQHMRDRTYECRVCGKTYRTRSCLNKHEFLHTGERPYRCEVCNVAFPRNTNLKLHYRSKQHQKKAAQVQCEDFDDLEEDIIVEQDDLEFAESIIEELDE